MTQTLPGSLDQPQDTPVPLPKAKRKPKPLLALPIVLALGGIGYGIWQFLPRSANPNLRLSGRIEVYETNLGVKRSGRVESVAVREGAAVQQGQVLVTMDDTNDQVLQDQLRGATARVQSAQQEVEQAQSEIERVQNEIAQIDSQIQEAQLNVQQSEGDAQGRIEQARSQVAAAKAQLAQAQAQVTQADAEQKLAAVNRDRYAALVREGATNQQQFDQAQTALETAVATYQARVAAVEAARQQLSAAEGSLTQAETTGLNPDIRTAQVEALRQKQAQSQAQLRSAQAKLKAAQARVKDAQATQQQVQTQLTDSKQDLNVVSPLDGVVTARNVEPGAVVDNRSKLLTLIDPKTVYLRGFIPQGEIGQVRLGQTVNVYLDSAPDRPLNGKVIAIDPQASFTPENIYFQRDRVKQVVGVRISVENPAGCYNPATPYAGGDLPCAKQGMPADAEIVLHPNS